MGIHAYNNEWHREEGMHAMHGGIKTDRSHLCGRGGLLADVQPKLIRLALVLLYTPPALLLVRVRRRHSFESGAKSRALALGDRSRRLVFESAGEICSCAARISG